jgi:beta-1,4-mannosyl-glycoprotein beta-1,4-N-acetylglucosaminyltransferase
MKIVDCFIFYNELDLLTYRLNLLNDVVDYFIIVESTHTFVGKEKNLFYNENIHLFENFNKKIIHVIVDDFPYKYPNIDISKSNAWTNEFFQRDAISRGINRIDNLSNSDLIIISDLDEIPDPRTLDKIKKDNTKIDISSLEMDFYYYNLNTKFVNKWNPCKIISYEVYNIIKKSCTEIRSNNNCPKILNGGWHLSYFGDIYFIQNKIQNFSHQELNVPLYTELKQIECRVKNFSDLYDRNEHIKKINIKENEYLPKDYEKYLGKYYTTDDVHA